MSETEIKLIHAAIDTFARYGFRRTTMGDIATAAGLSRPTLYARFSNKDDILAAAIETVGAQTLASLETAWRETRTTTQVLTLYCHEIVLKQYEMLKNMPDSGELFSAMEGPGDTALQRVMDAYSQAMSTRLRAVTANSALGPDMEEIARFFVAASKGLKKMAKDKATLEAQLDLLIRATDALIEVPVRAPVGGAG